MDLKGIISVSGKSGLYKVISQTKNGLIVEALEDGKRMPVYSTQKVSTLEDISVYTHDEDVPLIEVFKSLVKKENGKASLSHKAESNELRTHFSSILKDYDEERVYDSDIKKIYQWYNILADKGLLKEEEKESPKASGGKKKTSSKKTADSADTKKATDKKATTKTASTTKKTPAKNTTKAASKAAKPAVKMAATAKTVKRGTTKK